MYHFFTEIKRKLSFSLLILYIQNPITCDNYTEMSQALSNSIFNILAYTALLQLS